MTTTAAALAQLTVARGRMKVVTTPCVLRTVVGPGIAVAVCPKERTEHYAGLLHIPLESFSLAGNTRTIIEHLSAFLQQCMDMGIDLAGAKATVVGGADILGALTGFAHNGYLEQFQQTFTPLFEQHGLQIKRLQLGGRRGRSVRVYVPRAKVEVNVVGARKRPSPIPPSTLLPSTSLPQPLVSTPSPQPLTINMGCLHVTEAPAVLTAILGSCVGIALYDRVAKIGGLAHVMMPEHPGHGESEAKYADSAVPALLAKMEALGATRNAIRAKIAGGANVLISSHANSALDMAARNIASTKIALLKAAIRVQQEHLGGKVGRKMFVSFPDFSMQVKMLKQQ